MPTKYNYSSVVEDSQGTGDNAITATVNKDSGYPIRVDADYTLSDEEHDQDILVTSSGSVTITLDPTELREGFEANVYNDGGATIDFTVDGSNFSGSTSLTGLTGTSSSSDEITVFHLTPGEFHASV